MREKPEEDAQRDSRTDADYRSCEDFVVAVRSLASAEVKRLWLQGRALCLGTSINAKALLSDAIEATADGERRWPRDVSIGAYLFMAMKSLASNVRRKEAQLIHVPVGGDASGRGDRFADIPDPAASPETRAILADAEARAFELLKGDELAQWLLISRVEGESVAEFCQCHGISNAEYEAVSKRLQRKLRSLKAEA